MFKLSLIYRNLFVCSLLEIKVTLVVNFISYKNVPVIVRQSLKKLSFLCVEIRNTLKILLKPIIS